MRYLKTFDQKRLPAVEFSVRLDRQPEGFAFLLPADGWELVETHVGVISHIRKSSALRSDPENADGQDRPK